MAFWYDINNKKYAENDKRSWTRAYSEKLVGDLRDEQNSKFGKHTSGADYRHPAADLDCTNGKTVQEVLDSHTSTCQSLTEAVGKKVDKVTGKGLSANDYTDSDKAEVAKVKDKVDKVTGKGLSSNDYTSEEKAEVAKIKNKVDKVTGKGLSANDYTAAEKAEVAKIKDKVDKVSGKGLSTNDFTSAYKTKLDNLDTNLNAKANASAVLTKTNTTAFTPTGDYQPATKKYVDDKVVGPISVSVPTASWSTQADSSGSSYYYKKITVSGTKSTGQPLVDVVLPSNSVSEAMKALEAYRCVDKIVVGDNYIELYCFEVVPTSAFTLTVMIFG